MVSCLKGMVETEIERGRAKQDNSIFLLAVLSEHGHAWNSQLTRAPTSMLLSEQARMLVQEVLPVAQAPFAKKRKEHHVGFNMRRTFPLRFRCSLRSYPNHARVAERVGSLCDFLPNTLYLGDHVPLRRPAIHFLGRFQRSGGILSDESKRRLQLMIRPCRRPHSNLSISPPMWTWPEWSNPSAYWGHLLRDGRIEIMLHGCLSWS